MTNPRFRSFAGYRSPLRPPQALAQWVISRAGVSSAAAGWLRGAAAAVALTACSCAAPGGGMNTAQGDPFLDAVGGQAAAAEDAPGTARLSPPNAPIVPASATAPAIEPVRAQPMHIEFTAAEARVADETTDSSGEQARAKLAELHPDEYLWDGGDRGLPVHYDQFNMRGLETEDAVAEYADDSGKRHVKASNRVAVYAPRFAAVTTVSEPMEGVAVGRVSGATVAIRDGGMRTRQTPLDHQQREAVERLNTRERGSGLSSPTAANEFDRLAQTATHQLNLNTFMGTAFVHGGQFKQSDEARLSLGLKAAVAWSREQNPVISAHSSAAGQLNSRFNVSELVGLDDLKKQVGELRIVKFADRQTAATGDVITFTIRFDNLGDRPVDSVVIVDNLTPRLEYVNDSATCSHKGRLVETDNGEGSLVLRWELAEPLPGKTGGVVTFEARVR